jgi:hypothetical protein
VPSIPVTADASAAAVFVPPSKGVATMFLTNNSSTVVYVGGASVTPTTGFPLPPGQSLDVSRMTASVFAVTPYTATATATTTTAALAAGATTVAVTSGAGISNGGYIALGAIGGTGAEVVTVISGGGTASLTTTAAQFDHATGVAVTVVTPNAGSVTVVAGTN